MLANRCNPAFNVLDMAVPFGGMHQSEGRPPQNFACPCCRGAGLFVGVQLSSRELTTRVVNGLRREGVLIGAAGRYNDALKIRPPLTIQRAEVDLLLETLGRVLEQAR